MKTCPNCDFQSEPTDTECLKCGIIYEKWEAIEARKKALERKQDEERARKNAEAQVKRVTEEEAERIIVEEKRRAAEEEAKKVAEEEEAKRNRKVWDAKKAITAKRAQSKDYVGGKEGTLEGIGTVFIVFGTLALIVGFLIAVSIPAALGIPIFIGAFFLFVQGWVVKVFFSGGAEIIRLLKKLNGLPYGGKIKQPFVSYGTGKAQLNCSECGNPLSDDKSKFCNQCGRVLID